jgi:diguanylate cyclase (GGDEF)-like protein
MGAKILIVDDSEDIHALLDQLLAAEDYLHFHAYDAEQGYWYAKRGEPDLILLDVSMPRGSGFELCRALKRDAQITTIPVIFLTARNDVIQKVEGLDCGAVDYITKPFEREELRARVRAGLRTKQLLDTLTADALIDSLTRLRNRRYFEQRLAEELAEVTRFGGVLSLLLLDIDHFKLCNDRFGHSFGDAVLRSVADVLQRATRSVDILCRIGGEEFAVIMPETEREGALLVSERIRAEIADAPLVHGEMEVALTISGGLATSPPAGEFDGLTSIAFFQTADQALYLAKERGRNRIEASPWSRASLPPGTSSLPAAESSVISWGQDEPVCD